MEKISVEELDKLMDELFDKRVEVDEAKRKKADLENELTALKQIVIAHLKELDREKYAAARGSISVTKKANVRMPQDPEDKQKLWAWMKERDIFDQYATVNYQSLNSLYKAELLAAEEKGIDAVMGFSLPGVEAPTVHEDLTMRKSK